MTNDQQNKMIEMIQSLIEDVRNLQGMCGMEAPTEEGAVDYALAECNLMNAEHLLAQIEKTTEPLNRFDFNRIDRAAINAAVSLEVVDAVSMACIVAEHGADIGAIKAELDEIAYISERSGTMTRPAWARWVDVSDAHYRVSCLLNDRRVMTRLNRHREGGASSLPEYLTLNKNIEEAIEVFESRIWAAQSLCVVAEA